MSLNRDVAAAPQTPPIGAGPRPTLGAHVSLKLLFGYVTIFSSADLFTTDLNCRKKLACDIISEMLRHFISQNLEYSIDVTMPLLRNHHRMVWNSVWL